ncbi:transcription repressor OFP17-like [Magnolia sinica]|uniref:transcription repressor OFP17-like n=1 Tax=Magnolia sinica TaxID=86752 RepID=UPI002657E6CF|nr:transcription repressor OFP17-like [Magnolia sinica]
MLTSIHFKAKLLKPCNKLLQLLKLRFKSPIFKPLFHFRKVQSRKRIPRLFSIFWSSMWRSKETENVGELRRVADIGQGPALFPSPITPVYVKVGHCVDQGEDVMGRSNVEDSCRSFENYLVEMIVEEGNAKDLIDVEELLYCWKNLKCPVFHDLVCRFYGELCRDLFSGEDQEEDEEEMHGSK